MEPPIKPDESDCCNSSCNPCILDVYEEQLRKYKKQKSNAVKISTVNCISPITYSIWKLTKVEPHGEDANLYTFKFLRPFKNPEGHVSSNLSLQYNPGQYFLLKAGPKNDEFTRAYTPLLFDNEELEFTVLVKLYEYGRMSKFLKRLKPQSETQWRGPYGDYTVTYSHQHLLLVAQGVGITPIYNVIKEMLENTECDTILKLFFCCKNSETIYLRDKLYEFQSYWNFTYEIFLGSSVNLNQKYNEIIHNTKLTEEIIKEYLIDKINSHVVIAGSENFMELIKNYVLCAGINKQNVFLF